MHNADILEIPPATGIDYTCADEIYGYHLLLVKIFEREGGLDYPPVNNSAIREVRRQGAIWLREVKFLISDILKGKSTAEKPKLPDLSAIPDLIRAYDFIYRICNGAPCFDYIRDVKLKTIDRWLKGDKSISDTDVTLLILSETDRDIRSIDKRYADYAFSVLGEWVDELTQRGHFRGIPMAEAYSRLSYMLDNDLFVYFGDKKRQDAAKTAWTNNYVLQDHTSLDTRTLLRYIGFLLTANICGYYADEPAAEPSDDELYCRLWTDYIARPDIHPFFRQALSLDLATLALA